MVTGVVPSPPRFLPSIFIAHRVQPSHCSSIFHRVLLTRALALSASQFVHKRKSQWFYTSMRSAGLEFTKLAYTRLGNNLIRHRVYAVVGRGEKGQPSDPGPELRLRSEGEGEGERKNEKITEGVRAKNNNSYFEVSRLVFNLPSMGNRLLKALPTRLHRRAGTKCLT